ncbi:MAG: hypothetical protein A07HB70_02153 [uncultured archaeon A07HB70]|nr:MAG: hypothetical protein A07HB70_02153 [uncultured archaeon A07HB70]
MYDPINPGFYHLWSSGLAGLLGLAWIYLTSSRSPSTDRGGSISWISIRQFYGLLLLAVWTHIAADVVEHGGAPSAISGAQGAIRFLTGLYLSVL